MRNIIIGWVLLSLLSCGPGDPKNETVATDTMPQKKPVAQQKSIQENYYLVEGDSIVMNPFTIKLDLSEKAVTKLNKLGETIIVAAFFNGDPRDTVSKAYQDRDGEYEVAYATREINPGGTAEFRDVKFSKGAYDSLANKNVRLLINVYTGRRKSPDNLLNCDIFEDSASDWKDKVVTLKGKLIYGDK